MIRFVLGSGKSRTVFDREEKGPAVHEQRRDFKRYIGLLK